MGLPWVRVLIAVQVLSLTAHGLTRAERCRRGVHKAGEAVDFAAARQAFRSIHEKYLPPREAEMATEVRMKYLDVGRDSQSSAVIMNVPAKDYGPEAEAMLSKVEEFREFWSRYTWPEGSSARQEALNHVYQTVQQVRAKVEQQGSPSYGDLLTLADAVATYCHDSPDHFLMPSGRSFRERLSYSVPFEVVLPISHAEGNHLGFRKLNDRSVAALGIVEIPHLKPTERIEVDGNAFDYGFFVFHDLFHADEMFGGGVNKQGGISAAAGIPKLHEIAQGQPASTRKVGRHFGDFLEHLKFRASRYEKVRAYIDGIPDKKKRILAEGVWFSLDHELVIAYSQSQDDVRPALGPSKTITDFVWKRFQDPRDLGQAFKDRTWITRETIDEILNEFGKITELKFTR